MRGAIGLAANNQSSEPIYEHWERVGSFEDVPSMGALDYPPHFTLAIYDQIDGQQLVDVAGAISENASAIRIVFDRIRYFESSPLVLWASPRENARLQEMHQEVHKRIDPAICRENYRPNRWVAHCTLGTRVQATRRNDALSYAAAPIEPFEVVFDTIDCVEFPPVRLTDRITLI
jgi:2'-5' RNA ligase